VSAAGAPPPAPAPDAAERERKLAELTAHIAQALGAFHPPGSVFEERALGVPAFKGKSGEVVTKTWSGYFDDPVKAAAAIVSSDARLGTIYFTPNPCVPDALSRAANRIRPIKNEPTTKDTEIARRRWLLVDADPVRLSGVSSTDDEHEAAIALTDAIAEELVAEGWPEPIQGDSGNGANLCFPIDLPNDEPAKLLVERCLAALAARYDTPAVVIDTTVHNAARIWRVPYTKNRKGDSTETRPHRWAKLLRVPEVLEPAALELLEALAALAPSPDASPGLRALARPGEATKPMRAMTIEELITHWGLTSDGAKPGNDGATLYTIGACLFDPTHKDAAFGQYPNGARFYSCFHETCSHTWKEVRAHFGDRGWDPEDPSTWDEGCESDEGVEIYWRQWRKKMLARPRGKNAKGTIVKIEGKGPDARLTVFYPKAERTHVILARHALPAGKDARARLDWNRQAAEKTKGQQARASAEVNPPSEEERAWAEEAYKHHAAGSAAKPEDKSGAPRFAVLPGGDGADGTVDASGDGVGGGEPRRWTIYVNDRQLRDMATDALEALHERNDPPTLFVRGGEPTRIQTDEDGRPRTTPLTEPMLRHSLTACADFFIQGEKADRAVPPPRDVVQDILAHGQWPFPALRGISEAPFLRPGGTVCNTPGYDRQTGIFYWQTSELDMPAVSDSPSESERKEARALLDETLVDFPFVDAADRANEIGLMITVVSRHAISGAVPCAAITATTQGTGKGYLMSTTSIASTGQDFAADGAARADEEWTKKITSTLLGGASLVVFDNVEGELRSPALARAITAPAWKDRVLGLSKMVELPVRVTWVVTGNNITFAGDMARRSYPIRLDAKLARPWERKPAEFRHPNLIDWARANRGRLLWALLTLARAWYAAETGRRIADHRRLRRLVAHRRRNPRVCQRPWIPRQPHADVQRGGSRVPAVGKLPRRTGNQVRLQVGHRQRNRHRGHRHRRQGGRLPP
jgi:hypothetical protein